MISVNTNKIDIKRFPDNTLLIKFAIQSKKLQIQWFYESDEEIFALICATKHLRRINPELDLSLYMPYIPHARMDRVKGICDVFTLKYFAEIINSLNFTSVSVLDPHSPVSEALLNRIELLPTSDYIMKVCKEVYQQEVIDFLTFYPDNGSVKRYHLSGEYAYAEKERDWETGDIKGLNIIGKINPNQPILIIDDICSKGGTFYHAAKKLKELGAGNIYLYVTHCENSILDGELINSGLVKKIYTTNSIFTKQHELIEAIQL